jgi:hypothetical protein
MFLLPDSDISAGSQREVERRNGTEHAHIVEKQGNDVRARGTEQPAIVFGREGEHRDPDDVDEMEGNTSRY